MLPSEFIHKYKILFHSATPEQVRMAWRGRGCRFKLTADVIALKPFEPASYQCKVKELFPFFDPAIEKHLVELGDDTLLGRENNINQPNRIIPHREIEIYQPIICQVVGKTTVW